MDRLVRASTELALVADRKIEDSKKRLVAFSAAPMRLFAGLVPQHIRLVQVVVFLGVVCAVVAHFAEHLRVELGFLGQIYLAPHVLPTEAGWEQSGDQRRSCWGTYGSVGPAGCVTHPLC